MRLNKLVKWGGYLITTACLVLIGIKIHDSRLWSEAGPARSQSLGLILTGAGVFACNCFWLALAWAAALNSLGRTKIPLKTALAVYGRSWLAKYLPGNVFHFAGRHILGRSIGLDHGRLAAALIYEAGGQVAVAGVLVLWGSAVYGLDSKALSLPLLLIFILAGPLVWLGLGRLALHPKIAPRLGLEPGTRFKISSRLWPVPLMYAIYYLVSGLTLWLVLGVSAGEAPAAPWGYVVSLFSLSWILGYITPGAPAGLGVREAVLVFGLSPLTGEAAALSAALHLRLMTVGGDLLFFFFCRLLPLDRAGEPPGE